MAAEADRLLAWAAERGLRRPDLRVESLPGRGLGLVATRAFAAGEALLEVPDALLVTSRAAGVEDKALGPIGRLVLWLVRERRLGEASEHAPYLSVLPRAFDTPLFWSEQQLAHLGDEAAISRLRRAAAEAARAEREVEKYVAEHAGALPPRDGDPGALREEARWAWSCVMTRGLYAAPPGAAPGDKYCLAPVGDLFNFGAGESDGAHDAAGGCYRFTARRGYAAGEEVLLSYGAHPNVALLETYGFCLPPGANPDDTADLTERLARMVFEGAVLPFVGESLAPARPAHRGKAPLKASDAAREAQNASEELAALKAQLLFENGLAAGHELLATGEPSFSLRAALRVAVMNDEEHAAGYLALQDQPVSARGEVAAERCLAALCGEALEALRGAPAWPEGGPGGEARAAAARAWREGQIAILERGRALAEERLLAALAAAQLEVTHTGALGARRNAPAGAACKKKGGAGGHGHGCGCCPPPSAPKGRPKR
eukprot:tig00021254_g19685.t1